MDSVYIQLALHSIAILFLSFAIIVTNLRK